MLETKERCDLMAADKAEINEAMSIIRLLERDTESVCYITGISSTVDACFGKMTDKERNNLARAEAEAMLETLNQLNGSDTPLEIRNPERRYRFGIISAARAKTLDELMRTGIKGSIELNNKYKGRFEKGKCNPATVEADFDELMREQSEKVTPWMDAYKGLEPVEIGYFIDKARKYKIGDIVDVKELANKKIVLYDHETVNFMRLIKSL
jgi:hypothetical protein